MCSPKCWYKNWGQKNLRKKLANNIYKTMGPKLYGENKHA